MKEKIKKPYHLTGIRILVSVHERIREEAEKRNRTVNNLIGLILEDWLDQRDEEAKHA